MHSSGPSFGSLNCLLDIIKKTKLLDACINGNVDVFTEIKKICLHSPAVPTTMDGVKDDIPNHFK